MATTNAAEAVRAAGRSDHRAAGACLAELFARHGATVLGLCRVLLRHREEAEDAVQQTFLSAYRSLLNGSEPRHPAAWLATIARNECWGRIEQRMREPLSEREPVSTLPDPVAAAAARADLAELWRAIGELPRQQRKALLLREFSGLSYGELAEALAVSEPAVESLLFRARRELRSRLKPAYTSLSSVAPLAAIREALARAIGGMPDPASAGALAKLASLPLVAKLAAGTAAVVIAGGTVAAVKTGAVDPVTLSAEAATGVTPPAGQPAGLQPAVPVRGPVSQTRAPAKPKRPVRATGGRTARPQPAPVFTATAAETSVRPESSEEPSASSPVGSASPTPPEAGTAPPPAAPTAAPSEPAAAPPSEEGQAPSSNGEDSGSASDESGDDGTSSGGNEGEGSDSSGPSETADSSDEGSGSSGSGSESHDGDNSGPGDGGGDGGDGGGHDGGDHGGGGGGGDG